MKRFLKSPAILLLLCLVVLNMVTNPFADFGDWIMGKLMILPGILIGLSFHEFAHGIVSYALGDPTPKLQGRLSISPAAHMDPFGFCCLLFAGFGWGVPVEIDPRYYKHRRAGELLVSLAGVAMNFLLAILFTVILKGLFIWQPAFFNGEIGQIIMEIILGIISINVVLMIFNLLPVPPLDGFGILTEIFNLRKYSWYYPVYDKGFLILLLLVLLNVTELVLTPAVSFVTQWIFNVFLF